MGQRRNPGGQAIEERRSQFGHCFGLHVSVLKLPRGAVGMARSLSRLSSRNGRAGPFGLPSLRGTDAVPQSLADFCIEMHATSGHLLLGKIEGLPPFGWSKFTQDRW